MLNAFVLNTSLPVKKCVHVILESIYCFGGRFFRDLHHSLGDQSNDMTPNSILFFQLL